MTFVAIFVFKYDLFFVPVYGICRLDGVEFDVVFEMLIFYIDVLMMTKAVNDSLSVCVL